MLCLVFGVAGVFFLDFFAQGGEDMRDVQGFREAQGFKTST